MKTIGPYAVAETFTNDRGQTIRPGDVVRVSAGPKWGNTALGPRGTFRVRNILLRRERAFLDGILLQDGLPAGCYTLYIAGRPYRRAALPGVVFRPHRIRKVRR